MAPPRCTGLRLAEVAALLDAWADAEARDKNGHPAARCRDRADAIAALLDAGADARTRGTRMPAPRCTGLRATAADAVAALLDAGADPNARDKDGRTPLHGASEERPCRAVAALLDAGADPNARDKDGETPLHGAASTTLHITSWPRSRRCSTPGPMPNARDKDGATPLHWAAYYGHAAAVAALLDAGADAEARNEYGRHPAALCCGQRPSRRGRGAARRRGRPQTRGTRMAAPRCTMLRMKAMPP